MKLEVLYFAAARERAGCAREAVELPSEAATGVVDANALWTELVHRHPLLAPLKKHLRLAVNHQFAPWDAPLVDGSEVALVPPVAGGAPDFALKSTPLSLDAVVALVSGAARGAVVTFTGQVRNHSQGRAVRALDYEAYAPMVERVLASIGDEVAKRWPGTRLAIHHREGSLVPGDMAVVIAAAAPHRAEAFAACAHAIERLKQDAPIWKREHAEDGTRWVGLGP